MKSFGFLSAAAGLALLGLVGVANAAPAGTALPNLSTLAAADGSVEQAQYGYRRHHRRCHWVKHCGHHRCHWHRRCHH